MAFPPTPPQTRRETTAISTTPLVLQRNWSPDSLLFVSKRIIPLGAVCFRVLEVENVTRRATSRTVALAPRCPDASSIGRRSCL